MEEEKNKAAEPKRAFNMVTLSEDERLRRDIFRSDSEKFRLFILMLRRNAMYKKATVTHKTIIHK